MLQQVGAHAGRVGLRLVDLVDRDDHRHAGGLGVIDGLDRLRHDAVVGGHHQHDDVRHLGAAGAHGGEGGVAGRVDEGDLAARGQRDLIGADVLGDAAGFAGDDVGLADGVEQRGLAVVDVAHDGHDRRARLAGCRSSSLAPMKPVFNVGFRDALDGVAEFLDDQFGGVGVDHVGDLVHRALLHQQLDDVDRALGHAVGQFLDGDRFGNDDFAHDFVARLLHAHGLEAFAFALALQGRQGAFTLLLVEGVVDGELDALFLRLGRGLDRCADDLAAPLDDARLLVFHHFRTSARFGAHFLALWRLDGGTIGSGSGT